MGVDDEAARQARAARLRRLIAQRKGGPAAPADEPASPEPAPGESPREFVERRMRELEQEKQKE